MFSYLKSLITSKPEPADTTSKSYAGCLYHLFYPTNNYEKKAIVNSGVATIHSSGYLYIENEDYMGDPEEIEWLRFGIDEAMHLTRYLIRDEEEMIYGFKFVNVGGDVGDEIQMVGFELFD
jgi:hypothetical protein